MKQQAIIEAIFHQFNEVVPVLWSLVGQLNDHVTEFRADPHLAQILSLSSRRRSTHFFASSRCRFTATDEPKPHDDCENRSDIMH